MSARLLPFAALAVLLATGAAATAAAPYRVERIPSAYAGGPVKTLVLLPPSYDREPGRRYPAIYFLHDGRGSERALFRYGVADELLEAMKGGRLPEAVVVSPRGVGTWFVDSADGKRLYGSFLTKELVPAIEARYRVRPERTARAAVGISMGGYGVVHWALLTPDLFVAVGALSPALQQLNWVMLERVPFLFRRSFTRVFGRSELANVFRKNDVYDLLLSRPELAGKTPELLLRCGVEDPYRLASITSFFARFCAALGVKHELVLEPGRHDWSYWKRALPALFVDVGARLAHAEAGP